MKANSLLVSVVIPVFNRDSTIERAINSVINQTYKNIEIIVVDDGSTDNTSGILANYSTDIITIRQNNSGPSNARNSGIYASTGYYIAFLDSDDEWEALKIQRQVDALAKAGKDVSCCLTNINIHSGEDKSIYSFDLSPLKFTLLEGVWENPLEVLSTRCVLFTQAVMVRREVLINIGLFHNDLWLMEDHHLALRLALVGPWVYIQEPLVHYYQEAEDRLSSLSQTQRVFYLENIIKLYEDILTKSEIPPKEVRLFKRRIVVAYNESKLLKSNSVIGIYLYKFYEYFRRVYNAFWRRTPFYPCVVESPLVSLKK